ncbi:aminodeoxychorismate lyase [Pseudomonas eucalypticola]|uniref:Aminodeoxychorismate lyase n=1 Tax=Pseudomonas eucalypticola TaxID=2599595 RepID=A0A7D5D9A0_9PSED|nr:aminodeoxychorismate lyase [Pseudomonas eucalypticola]QKZ06060.1 aminodeoxychorismate lyase [Pseudomonas eucalypticola]
MFSWVDGQPADTLAVKNRGLAYGDGVFETIAVKAGRPTLLARHLHRLVEGGARLSIGVDAQLVERELLAAAALLGEGVLKLVITRGDSQRGYAADPLAAPRRLVLANAPAAYPVSHAQQGVRLFDCQTRLAEQPLLAGLKHLNRLEQVLARSEWSSPDYAEGLMRDTSGRLVEGVFSNLFLVRDGHLLTADLSRCGVAGVMRAELLAQAERLGIQVQVRDLWLADLEGADEVFVCNSVYGIWPVYAFVSLNWSAGPLTRKLQSLARAVLDV